MSHGESLTPLHCLCKNNKCLLGRTVSLLQFQYILNQDGWTENTYRYTWPRHSTDSPAGIQPCSAGSSPSQPPLGSSLAVFAPNSKKSAIYHDVKKRRGEYEITPLN